MKNHAEISIISIISIKIYARIILFFHEKWQVNLSLKNKIYRVFDEKYHINASPMLDFWNKNLRR